MDWEPDMQSLINYESHLVTTCTLWSIIAKNSLVQTSKVWANGKLHVNEPHVGLEAQGKYHCIKGYNNSLQANKSESDLPSIMWVGSENFSH